MIGQNISVTQLFVCFTKFPPYIPDVTVEHFLIENGWLIDLARSLNIPSFCRRIVAQNYLSQTHKDLTPYTRPYGTEVLPRSTHQVPSGFINEKALTVPNLAQVCFEIRFFLSVI